MFHSTSFHFVDLECFHMHLPVNKVCEIECKLYSIHLSIYLSIRLNLRGGRQMCV